MRLDLIRVCTGQNSIQLKIDFFFFFLVPPLNFLYSPAEQDTVAEITELWGKVLEETKDEESSYLELILENDSFNSEYDFVFSV